MMGRGWIASSIGWLVVGYSVNVGAASVRVPAEDVAAARASRPANDETFVRNELARAAVGGWESGGQVSGKVIFTETFDDPAVRSSRWTVERGAEFRGDGRGGTCAAITPVKGGYAQILLKPEAYLPVSSEHPYALYWEARSPEGGSPVNMRIDYYDAERKHLRAHQVQSVVDVSEAGIFHRNSLFLGTDMPRRTAFVRLEFNQAPRPQAEKVGEVGKLYVVDLIGLSEAALEARRPVQSERKAAGDRVLCYVSDSVTSCYPVMPTGEGVPGRAGDVLQIRECPGEKTRASIVLWSARERADVTMVFSDLVGERGRVPASCLSAKVVKCHYQAVGAPYGNIALDLDQVLVPELLLNDENVVVADHEHRRNFIRCQNGNDRWYENVNEIYDIPFKKALPIDRFPVKDADRLQPFRLEAGLNKQIVLRVAVPEGQAAGVYSGVVGFKADGHRICEVPLELEVLPFELPRRAETIYDPKCDYTMGIYSWTSMSGDGTGSMTPIGRSREQMLSEYRTMIDNGITTPTFIWPNDEVVFDERRFREHLDVAREAGYSGNLYLGWSGAMGRSSDPNELAAMQERLKRAMAVAKEYGFNQVYFYGYDEAVGDLLVSQLPAWRAAHAVGAKTIVSGYRDQYEKVGKELDVCVWVDTPASANPAQWHAQGSRLWKYGTPQAGPENPDLYRRNYGLDLWRYGFDAGNTYCATTLGMAWNDLYQLQRVRLLKEKNGHRFRSESVLYPTVDGVIETLSLTGLASAIKDVRYMTKLRQLLRRHPNEEVEQWIRSIKFDKDDLSAVRRGIVDRIVRLMRSVESDGGAAGTNGCFRACKVAGRTAPGAWVVANSGEIAQADEKGRYEITLPVQGVYCLKAMKDGYDEVTRPWLTVPAPGDVNLSMWSKPNPKKRVVHGNLGHPAQLRITDGGKPVRGFDLAGVEVGSYPASKDVWHQKNRYFWTLGEYAFTAEGEVKIVESLDFRELRDRGWYKGDFHAHISHGEDFYHVNLQQMNLVCRAERFDWIWLSQEHANDGYPTDNVKLSEYLSDGGFFMRINNEFPKDAYGHFGNIGVGPLWTNDYGPDYNPWKTTSLELAEKTIYARGGLAIPVHPIYGDMKHPDKKPGRKRWWMINNELMLWLLCRPEMMPVVDFFYFAEERGEKFWYFLLNKGYKIGCSGSSDAAFDVGRSPGDTHATYAKLDSLDGPAVVRAFRERRTMVSYFGAGVLIDVDGKTSGDEFPSDGKSRKLRVDAYADPGEGFSLYVMRNGEVFEKRSFTAPEDGHFVLECKVSERENAWYLPILKNGKDGRIRAAASPVYFRRPDFIPPEVVPLPSPLPSHIKERILYLTPDEMDTDDWYQELKQLLKSENVERAMSGKPRERSFVHASWNVGHYCGGIDSKSHLKADQAGKRGDDYRRFLNEVGATTLGLCEFSSSLTADGRVDARQTAFRDYRQGCVGQQEDYQWNALLHRDLECVDKRVKYYPKHKQNVYYVALWLKPRDGLPIVFVQTHLDWAFENGHETDRADQIRTLIEDFKDEPRVVISGDFNVGRRWRDEKGKYHEEECPQEFLAFARAGYQLGNVQNLPTCPSDKPKSPIDNILAKGVRLTEFKVWPVGGLSDHNLVSARIWY